MGLEDRLKKLEGENGSSTEDKREREKWRMRIREEAQRLNDSFFEKLARERRGELREEYGSLKAVELAGVDASDAALLTEDDVPPFVVDEATGRVFSAKDGKPITKWHQTLAEVWYWQALEWDPSELVHDEEKEAFYTPGGELALSRDVVDLQYLFRGLHGS